MFQHPRRDFLAVVGRHIVHKAGGRFGLGQQGRIHGVALKSLQPQSPFRLVPHTGPDIGINQVGIPHGGRRVMQGQRRRRRAIAPFLRLFQSGGVQFVAWRGSDAETHPQGGQGQGQAAGHIVAVANVSQPAPGQIALIFDDSGQVGQDLARMFPVGQGIDHRHGGIFGQFPEAAVGMDPGHDAVHIAGQDPGHIGHRLPDAQAHLLRPQVKPIAAQLLDAHHKAGFGAEGGLFEKQGDAFAAQGRGGGPGRRGFQFQSPADQALGIRRGQVGNGKKMRISWHIIFLSLREWGNSIAKMAARLGRPYPLAPPELPFPFIPIRPFLSSRSAPMSFRA